MEPQEQPASTHPADAERLGASGEAFADADAVVITDIYAAGEEPIEAISASGLAAATARGHCGIVHYRPSDDELAADVARLARAGDVVITLGAGDITKLGPKILSELGGLVG